MAEYRITGGKAICGELVPNGAKNAALPILAASVMTGDDNVFFRCPQISDVEVMKKILRFTGCNVRTERGRVEINSRGLRCCEIPAELMEQMRSSIFMAGPLLVRCGRAVISQPGGCSIGERPIDLHVKALKKLGAHVEKKGNAVCLTAEKLSGADIILDFPSVGATENIMMAALGAEGTTVIYNAAREPEIVDLQNYLICCGARMRGAGTSRIVVEGPAKLHGAEYEIMADRIEAGTYMMAAAATGGELLVSNIDPSCLKSCCRMLRFAGCDVKKYKCGLVLKAPERLYSVGKMKTEPYPGFPTDLQPQFTAIMSTAIGETHVEETIFEKRYGFIKELLKMGADIEIFRGIAIIKGNRFLAGANVDAADLRGGAALVIAGLMAGDDTVVKNIEYIERGYCNLHRELRKMGAEINRCI